VEALLLKVTELVCSICVVVRRANSERQRASANHFTFVLKPNPSVKKTSELISFVMCENYVVEAARARSFAQVQVQCDRDFLSPPRHLLLLAAIPKHPPGPCAYFYTYICALSTSWILTTLAFWLRSSVVSVLNRYVAELQVLRLSTYLPHLRSLTTIMEAPPPFLVI
jgi:hypothetical protein